MTPAWWKIIIDGAHQYGTRTGAGAIDVDKTIQFLESDSADAYTLADGEAGQHILLTMDTYVGIGTVTPANLETYTTIAFGAVGDWCCVRFNGRAWEVVAYRGVTLA